MSDFPAKAQQYIGADFDPAADRTDDQDWLKAAILYNALGAKRDNARGWKHLRLLKKLAPPAEFAVFKADLYALMHPMILTEHGFKKGLAAYDQAEVWAQVRKITDVLNTRGIQAFANSGTLLGLIRNNALLPHDDDLDIGIVLTASTAEQAASEMLDLMESLESWVSWGFLDWQLKQAKPGAHIKFKADPVPVDLFPCWIENGEFYAYPHGKIDTAKVLPLAERQIAGSVIPVPVDPEAFLEFCYGPGWRTPDETYSYPWGRSEKIFEPFSKANRVALDSRVQNWPVSAEAKKLYAPPGQG